MGLIYTASGVAVTAFIFTKVVEYCLRRSCVKLTDKYVFITGCDSGFGNELAKQLDSKGVHVIATCLTEKGRNDLDDVTSERVATLKMDVTDQKSVDVTFEKVKKIIPHESALWGVVNNAGISRNSGYMSWSKMEDYEKVMAVNFFGTVRVTLTFLPLLKKSRGRLVNVASCAGRLASQPAGYCESKFAVEAFSDIVRRERNHFGYRYNVSIIEPGIFGTQIASKEHMSSSVKAAWNRLSEEERREYPEKSLNKYIQTSGSIIDSLTSYDLSQVTDVMEHALFARWPKTRYTVGWDAKLTWVPLSYCPTWIQDCIV